MMHLKSYRSAFGSGLKSYRIIIFLFAVHVIFSYIFYNPLSKTIDSIFGNTFAAEELAQEFDYDLIADLLNQQGLSISIIISSFIIALAIYMLWSAFSAGGLNYVYKEKHFRINTFLKGGGMHFFKNLRLNVYLFIVYTVLLILMFLFFKKDGLNVLNMDSEVFLIRRFWMLIIIFTIIAYIVSIFRDIVRSKIVTEKEQYLYKTSLGSFGQLKKLSFYLLSLTNLAFLAVCLLLYKLTGNLLPIFLLSQVMIVLRIFYRMVRLYSFQELDGQIAR